MGIPVPKRSIAGWDGELWNCLLGRLLDGLALGAPNPGALIELSSESGSTSGSLLLSGDSEDGASKSEDDGEVHRRVLLW